ncbi:MAG: DUF4190 domain-containing protein [Demequina sp.]|jgi:hypothetical protein|nr:DUF4190 domain-containing protein [Demequina sp.]
MTTPDDNLDPEQPLVVEPVADTPPLGGAEPPLVPPQAAPAATPYAAPPAPPQAYAAPNDKPNTWMNIVAFVTGILGMAIIPIIFGHLGVSASNKGKAEFKWMGIVGLVLGYLEVLALVLFLIFAVVLVAASTTTS